RRRDGTDTLDNKSTFEACYDVLADGAHILIYPEGEVHRETRMLPLKNRAARIALGAATDREVRGITIVPVGMVYDDKGRFRSQAAIHVGRPVAGAHWARRVDIGGQNKGS